MGGVSAVGYAFAVRPLRLRSFAVLGSLVLAALALSHHLIYLVAHGDGGGYARAMTEAGHDRYWSAFLVGVVGAALALGAVAARELRRLARQAEATRTGALAVRDGSVASFARLLLPLAARLTVLTLLAFLVQENVETASVGNAMPGLGVVWGDHAIAVPMIAAVSFLIAAVAALVRWRRDILLARLRAVRLSFGRPLCVRPALREAPVTSAPRGDRNGVRAPPASVVAPA